MTNFTNTINPKGASMSDREHTAKTPSHRTGIFATLRALLRGQGTGAPSRTRALLATLSLTVLAAALTASPALAAPSLTPPIISAPSYTTAHVASEVDPHGQIGSYAFQVSTDGTNWTTKAGGFLFNKETLNADLTGLDDGTHYSVRLVASNGIPLSDPPEVISPAAPPYPEFTTLTADPTSVISTDNASEVAYTTAKASGEIDRPVKSNDVACHFDYITDAQFKENEEDLSQPGFQGATEAPCDTGNPAETPGTVQATGHVSVSAKLSTLKPATAYHLRLVVSNAANSEAKEAPSTFTTLAVDPPSVVSIENATDVEYTQAQVKGIVERPNTSEDPAFDVNCNFEYITDAQFKENEEDLSQPGFTGAAQVACEPEGNPAENPIHATGETHVKATLGGLLPSTTYHLRLSATNLGGTDSKAAASTFATAGPVPAPSVVSVDEATDLAIHTATATGKVKRPAGKDPALDVNCHFEYVTDKQFNENPPGEEFAGAGRADCIQNPITEGTVEPDGTQEVSAQLGGLRADTTFHLRLTAENLGGTDTEDATATFTTLPADLPSVSIDPITEDVFTTVHISGTLSGNGPIFGYLETSTDGTSWQRMNLGGQANEVSNDIEGLNPATTYYIRIAAAYNQANDSWGGFDGADAVGEVARSQTLTVTTEPLAAPTAVFNPVTGITPNGAHFSGSVDTNAPAGPFSPAAKAAYKTDWHFECTPACPAQPGLSGTVSAEEGSQVISTDVIRLDPNTHYQVKLIAKNVLETPVEPEQTFETLFIPPTVTALPGGSDGEGGYTIAGVVNPNNSPVTNCEFKWGPNSASYAFKADCSPTTPINGAKPVTVEAHLTGLNPGSVYHFKLFATNAAGTEESDPDREFTPTLSVKSSCSNEQLREENGSLGLPECRAYEMVTYPNKEGNSSRDIDFSGGNAVEYYSGAGNIVNSGQSSLELSVYVATRTAAGWQTIPDLNGPTGSLHGAPEFIGSVPSSFIRYSADLLSSIYPLGERQGGKKDSPAGIYLRGPDGRFVLVGLDSPEGFETAFVGASDDLSHIVASGTPGVGTPAWGPGVYEFVGTGNGQPDRVDVDNLGNPASDCELFHNSSQEPATGEGNAVSPDGRVVVFTIRKGCDGPSPANEIWARVEGTTSYDASASQCTRPDCNAPADATYQAAAKDGSRVYFTTTQQLVNGDTDETNDLYACDISTTPQAPVGEANSCSALHEASAGSDGKADVQKVLRVSDDGSTAYFTAKGVLADNEDALGEEALPGDKNLYVWRTDAAHPAGRIAFVARLPESDAPFNPVTQTTPDGRYLLLQTAGQLLDTDTDESTDIYRYDADTGEMARVSTAVSGAGGNGNFDVGITGSTPHHSHPSISDDGRLIVFKTSEPLAPLDGNGEPDAYLWNDGHALGSVAPLLPGIENNQKLAGSVSIAGAGHDIYINTAARLNASDVDTQSDVYDARIDGGFPQHQQGCVGETCQPPASSPPATPPAPANRPKPNDNAKPPKPCPKGKVRNKKGKCVKKSSKKHHKKPHKKAGHNRGGSK